MTMMSPATQPSREPDRAGDGPLGPVFEQSRIPMGLVDRSRNYLKVNEAALRLFQYSSEDVIGARAARTARDVDPLTGDAQWEQLVRNGEFYGERVVELGSGAPIRVSFAAHATSVGGQWAALIVAVSAHLEPAGADLIRTLAPDLTGPTTAGLTVREQEIVRRTALGQSTKRIADELYLSRHTVRTHVRNAMLKTGAHTSAQLVAIALTHGLIAP